MNLVKNHPHLAVANICSSLSMLIRRVSSSSAASMYSRIKSPGCWRRWRRRRRWRWCRGWRRWRGWRGWRRWCTPESSPQDVDQNHYRNPYRNRHHYTHDYPHFGCWKTRLSHSQFWLLNNWGWRTIHSTWRFHFAHHNEHEVDDDDNECEVDDDGNDDDDDEDDDEYKMRCMSNLQQQAWPCSIFGVPSRYVSVLSTLIE